MDLLVIELHEKTEKEKIPAEDYAVVHSTVTAMGFSQRLTSCSVEKKTLRACYVGSGRTPTSIQLMHGALEARLGRRVGVMFTAKGEVYDFGLEVVETYGLLFGILGSGPTGYNSMPGFGADYSPTKGGALSSMFE